ncbi:mechanosensitive ion channel family protein [Neptunomonas antarctica]|uniref:Mechanosensitive ion channel n=1 Tax=Neptunomonas antarctica TaxID=619304 RepID=A0A1N7N721_9GAMM|nr:mechanosensitive ion channel domain-containing protein [Neptunomonas antarctica]SIS94193.1 Mechanosensitive ion channel [Neptunomonas antarctica]
MSPKYLQDLITDYSQQIIGVLTKPETYIQLGIILTVYAAAYFIANRFRRYFSVLGETPDPINALPHRVLLFKFGNTLFPLLAILLLRMSVDLGQTALKEGWLLETALTVALLLLFNSVITDFIKNKTAGRFLKIIGLPILFLHLTGLLDHVILVLESISITLGNINVTAFGVLRVALFGTLLFWMGRASNNTGKEIIRRQANLDFRTKELAAKIFEVAVYVIVFLLLLQVMDINLTALAVFGGALGVGLGFGLQSIASNFISGVIILLDRSLSLGDYVEMEDGKSGIVRELNLRSTTLETFDGKDIMVPNEKFIASTFTNWTHKNKKQRYRVDFSVAYHTDIRNLVEIIKETVSIHPQVISGNHIPIEERPDCEIASFGDSGVNMFVEFWMEGIDDGQNRVGGDLLLAIFEAMRDNGFEIPFPQREVRILQDGGD